MSPTVASEFSSTAPPGKPCWLLFVVVQLLSHVQLFATPWTIVHQAPLSSSNLLEFPQTHVH